ncbi:M20/M25/M40 family metallo-hydrolase [Tuberibacillus sp. Marseille-P3662]|uniref:M20/M25/M40 family metallo-hydrolase n=1 Tax=Tuberibacillus sp. Marseille-P3662 TaxID=1965358 RepID=UPI000A1C9506|nr:M20/M25/M40 family metallo-hydrolase [Tuberibacillus sp. Marseille-P3662]
MNQKWQSKEQLTRLLTQLVEFPSITHSDAEIAISEYIQLRLSEWLYFQEHPDQLALHPTKDGRKLVSALFKHPSSKKTIVLLSHMDVVDVEDYGEWKNLAFRPQELTDTFYKNIAQIPEDVQKDMAQGEWLFGRGSMDMKAGLSLQLSLLEQACSSEFDGNVLFLTVPDEEANSLGMTTAAHILLKLADQYDLEYSACLNTEPIFSRYPGDDQYYVYSGSVGKVLPGFFCYGKETHVGEPFAGVNANHMVAQLSKLMELNTDFCERVGDEVTPPPTNLMQKDLKEGYSVQIPHTAVALYNVMLMEKSLDAIHAQLLDIGKQAAKNIQTQFYERAKQFSEWVSYQPDPIGVNVLTYGELRHAAIERYGQDEIDRREMYTLTNYQDLGDRDLTTRLVFDLASLCKHLAPMIVLFYSPPFYPAVASHNHERIQKAIASLQAEAEQQFAIKWEQQHFFPGLSDLSYTSLREDGASLGQLTGNMPLYGERYDLPVEALQKLDIPVMNVGPYGKDAHQWTERLNVDFSFGPLKRLLAHTVQELLK